METRVIEQQINIAFDKVKVAWRGWEFHGEGVKTFMLLKRLEDYPKMRKRRWSIIRSIAPHLVANPPVSTFMQLSSMTNPEALFEIDVTAFF